LLGEFVFFFFLAEEGGLVVKVVGCCGEECAFGLVLRFFFFFVSSGLCFFLCFSFLASDFFVFLWCPFFCALVLDFGVRKCSEDALASTRKSRDSL